MWQDNLSWKEGLFSEVTIGRLKGVKRTSEFDPVFAVYERLHNNGGNDWHNLKLKRFLFPKGEPISTLESIFSSFYVVAVDTRLRSMNLVCSFTTRRAISGSIEITVEYEVKDVQLLMRVADPLLALKRRVEQTVQDVAFDMGYPNLTATDIRKALLALEAEREIGIVLYNPLCGPVQWPGNIQTLTSQPVIEDLQNQNQETRNEYRRNKLAAVGITDPFIVTSVLSQDDKDFQIIVQHVQNYAQSHQSNAQNQLQLLKWLADENYITRADMQRLIGPLLDRISAGSQPQGSISSFLSGGQISTDRQIPSSVDSSSNDSPPSRQTNSSPTVTRRRTVDHDDSFDTIPPVPQDTRGDADSETPSSDNDDPVIKRRRKISFSDQDE